MRLDPYGTSMIIVWGTCLNSIDVVCTLDSLHSKVLQHNKPHLLCLVIYIHTQQSRLHEPKFQSVREALVTSG